MTPARISLALIAGTLAALLAPAPADATPSLALVPASGPPGATVTATGRGFPISRSGDLRSDGVVVATFRTSSRGGFRSTFAVPDVPPQTVKVTARVGTSRAVTNLTVTSSDPAARWTPAPGTTWQIQFTGELDLSVDAAVYEVDMFDTPSAVVADLHARGRKAVCYVSAGSWEDWRTDASSFPSAVKGKTLDGWPDERWLDIRRLDVLGPLMSARMDTCAAKGFDAIEFDNVDAYTQDTGFALTSGHQLDYNRFLAAAAHDRGLSAGLKNDLGQVSALQPDFDFAVNEQCFAYSECGMLRPFLDAGKAVFHIEYDREPSTYCPTSRSMGLSSVRKRLSLNAWRVGC